MKFFGLFIMFMLFAFIAAAQTPTPTTTPYPDVMLHKAAGVYPVGCRDSGSPTLADLCFARVDVSPVLELGCVAAAMNEEVHTTINVPPTPYQQPAEIRCYACDAGPLCSVYSLNAGWIKFAPGRPIMISRLRALRPPIRLYAHCSERVFEFDS